VSRFAALSCLVTALSCRAPSTHVTLPAGTEIKIRIEQDPAAGESFEAALAAPLFFHGKLLARAGSPVVGELEPSSGGPQLKMTLRSMEVNGRSHLLEAEPLLVDAAGIGPGAVFRLPLVKPLELPPTRAE
jgi:hypothetical protein